MSDDVVIRIEGLWKRYGLPLPAVVHKGLGWLRKGRNPQSNDGPWALRDINLEVKCGEALGIIGRNGAGKSTLLKILAGVTPPTRGRVEMRGRVFSMIELNAGLHPELTGRENVRLLGAIIGFTRQEMEAKMPAIEEFCELGEWFDRPVRKHSSGMLARLGFGVAMYVEAEILLIDEVLAVGDFAFQKRCVSRMAELSNSGSTILFVSHNPYIIERMCNRALMLQDGTMQELGQPSDIIYGYFESATSQRRADNSIGQGQLADRRPGTGDLRIRNVEILDAAGYPTREVLTGMPMTIRLYYETRELVWEPNFGIRIYDPQNTMILSLASTIDRKGIQLQGRGYVDCHVSHVALMPNIFTVQVKVAGDVLLDLYENAAQFSVRTHRDAIVRSGNMGIVYANAVWHYCK